MFSFFMFYLITNGYTFFLLVISSFYQEAVSKFIWFMNFICFKVHYHDLHPALHPLLAADQQNVVWPVPAPL